MPHIDALWAKIPVEVLRSKELAPTDKVVYGVLAAFAGGRSRWFGPREEIAAEAGCSVQSVDRALPKLIAQGFIQIQRQGMSRRTVNEYLILARPIEVERVITGDKSLLSPVTHAKTQKTDIDEEEEAEARARMWDAICRDCHVLSSVSHLGYWKIVKEVPEMPPALQRVLMEMASYNRNLRLIPGSVKPLSVAAEILAPLDLNDASFGVTMSEIEINDPDCLQKLAKHAVEWAVDIRKSYGKVSTG